MARFEAFDRELRLATAGLEPAAISSALAKFARSELQKAIAAGASPNYDTFVNGRKDAPLESVIPPGPIVFEFVNWSLVINAAIAELKKFAPRRSGRYAGSFIVLANQKMVADYRSIPSSAEVIIINKQPFTRRIESGGNKTGSWHFDRAGSAIARRFKGVFSVKTPFLNVGASVVPGVPYILKRSQGGRRDRQAGSPITYPAIVLNVL